MAWAQTSKSRRILWMADSHRKRETKVPRNRGEPPREGVWRSAPPPAPAPREISVCGGSSLVQGGARELHRGGPGVRRFAKRIPRKTRAATNHGSSSGETGDAN